MENKFKPAKYAPKEMPKNKICMHSVSESKTGEIWPVAEIVLVMVGILLALWAMDSLGWIEVVKKHV